MAALVKYAVLLATLLKNATVGDVLERNVTTTFTGGKRTPASSCVSAFTTPAPTTPNVFCTCRTSIGSPVPTSGNTLAMLRCSATLPAPTSAAVTTRVIVRTDVTTPAPLSENGLRIVLSTPTTPRPVRAKTALLIWFCSAAVPAPVIASSFSISFCSVTVPAPAMAKLSVYWVPLEAGARKKSTPLVLCEPVLPHVPVAVNELLVAAPSASTEHRRFVKK